MKICLIDKNHKTEYMEIQEALPIVYKARFVGIDFTAPFILNDSDPSMAPSWEKIAFLYHHTDQNGIRYYKEND